jgi:membrane protease YdiL (CAAX protease family)
MTTADNTAPLSGDARQGLLARHPLVFYFLIAYAGAWLLFVPVALSETGTGLLPFTIPKPVLALMIAAATFLGPTLSAFIMTGITEGRIGIRLLLRRYVLWRVEFRWYLFVLLGIPAIEVLGAIVLPGVLVSFQSLTLSLVLTYPVAFVSTFILGGPLGEEPGWRGFALPHLQPLHGPLVGSLILGILWALWHLPLFWSGVWTPPTIPNIVMFILTITALTIIMTWVFNNAKGSLLITMLMHASFNAFANGILTPLFPAPILSEYGLLPMLVGFWVVAVVLIGLTRARLGYQHYHPEETAQTTAPA